MPYLLFTKIRIIFERFLEYRWRPYALRKRLKAGSVQFEIGKNVRICRNAEISATPGTEIRLGDGVQVMNNSRIYVRDSGRLTIEEETYLGPNSEIYCRHRVSIGCDCLLAPYTFVIDHNHDWNESVGVLRKKFRTGPISIGNNCWLGARSIVLANAAMGDKATLGAGVVLRSVIPEKALLK